MLNALVTVSVTKFQMNLFVNAIWDIRIRIATIVVQGIKSMMINAMLWYVNRMILYAINKVNVCLMALISLHAPDAMNRMSEAFVISVRAGTKWVQIVLFVIRPRVKMTRTVLMVSVNLVQTSMNAFAKRAM